MNRTEYLEQQTKRRESRRPKPGLRPKSKKREAEQKEYVEIVREMMATSDRCEIKADGCTGEATGLHHIVKRSPKTFLDRSLLIRACDNCNGFCEREPLKAIAMGVVKSKFRK